MASLVTLPAPVLHLIYDQLTDAKDRAALASTCQRLNQEFAKGVKAAYVKIEDHRPYVKHLRMQDDANTTLERSRRNNIIANRLTVASMGSCATGASIAGSCGGCCCCKVSAIVSKVLCITGLSFMGAGCCIFSTAAAIGCCAKDSDGEVVLINKFNEEETLLNDFSQKLRIDRAPRPKLTIPPKPLPERSYQHDFYGPV